ncbi:PE domain-containing protein [Hoyosella rhizosphaerae]|uniref:PE family protein n=1 Tax=Hoyosella rhizosphaerae TaxID=1755582 RepID=UPI001669C832|nr:PE family protein [Hoyosella rhizosphaerae]MBN4927406.1 PE domain-containing protein [Hoyosella rhizosphaerae]
MGQQLIVDPDALRGAAKSLDDAAQAVNRGLAAIRGIVAPRPAGHDEVSVGVVRWLANSFHHCAPHLATAVQELHGAAAALRRQADVYQSQDAALSGALSQHG